MISLIEVPNQVDETKSDNQHAVYIFFGTYANITKQGESARRK